MTRHPLGPTAPLVCALLLALAPGVARAEGVADLEVRYWSADLSGGVRVGAAPLATAIDLASDLGAGLDDALEGRLTWRPTHRFFTRLEYTPLEVAGDAVVTRDLTFGGADFTLSTRVVSRLDVEYARLLLGYQILAPSHGRWRLGPYVGAIGLRGDASLSAPDLPFDLSAREELEASSAIAGLAFDVEARRGVEVFADWGTSVGADGGEVTDAQAGVRYRVGGPLTLSLGFRSIDIEAESDGDRLEVEVDGAFFGLGLKL